MCTWRKPQARKHKTWDGDAVLVVNTTRRSAVLRSLDTGRELSSSNSLQSSVIESGDQMMVGGKEIEIDRSISFDEYVSGKPDAPAPPPSKKPKLSSNGSTGGLNLMAPASSASFYNKPMPKPMIKPDTARVSPEVQRALDGERVSNKSTPVTTKSANSALKAPASSTSSPSMQARYGGLTKPAMLSDAVQPRYDPNEEGAIVMKRPDAEHQRMYNRRHFPLVDVVVSPHLALMLRPHQAEGVKFLYERVTGIVDVNNNNGAILADEMGLGKTLQTITLIDLLLRQSPYVNPSASRSTYIEKALIVCPLSLVKNWKREFRKWLGPSQLGVVAVDGNKGKELAQRFVTSKRDQVLIIGYEKLRTCIEILATAQPPIGLIVCDEGHRLKSKDAKTTKMFDRLSTPRRVILTGTPIQNDLSELYAMINFVCPGLLSGYSAFKAMFEDPILKSRLQHCTQQVRELGLSRSRTLTEVTSLVVLRRTADILDGFLLPKSECVVFCKPTALQLSLYRHVLRSSQVRALTTGNAGGSALPMITILRQLCDSPELLLKELTSSSGRESMARSLLSEAIGQFPAKADRVAGDETLSGKLLTLSRMLRKIRRETSDKVVVVSTFTSTLDVLEAFCKRQHYACVRLDGSTKQDARMDIVNEFNRVPASTSFVFLLSTKAGGVGLNLIGANRLFLMEPEWNPALDQQAMARIHRDGQKKHCYIYRMMLPGTMDEKIFQRQISKLGLSDTLMVSRGGGAGEGGGGGGSGKANGGGAGTGGGDSFSQDELKDIFTLHEDTACLCHDQLMCSCGGRGASMEGEVGQGDTDDGRAMVPSFIPASMQQATRDAEMARDAKARLAGLADWRHYDVRDASDFVSLRDDVLDGVIAAQKLEVGDGDVDEGSPSSSPLFLATPTTSSQDPGVSGNGHLRAGPRALQMSHQAAGNVVFVFVKSAKSGKGKVGDDEGGDSDSDSDGSGSGSEAGHAGVAGVAGGSRAAGSSAVQKRQQAAASGSGSACASASKRGASALRHGRNAIDEDIGGNKVGKDNIGRVDDIDDIESSEEKSDGEGEGEDDDADEGTTAASLLPRSSRKRSAIVDLSDDDDDE